jgi:hypothetical protein
VRGEQFLHAGVRPRPHGGKFPDESLGGASNAGLLGFIGTATASFAAITSGLDERRLRGEAALENLHRQTGESVGDLYKLQRGFEEVGIQSENLGPSILAMQRALGGTNEMGESTADIFRRMGLSANALKREGAAEQIQKITTALGQLNSSDASRAASSIFGRQNTANMLQIARSGQDFQKAIAQAGPQAAVFERVANTFMAIDRAIDSIKNDWGNIFTGIAEGLAPGFLEALGYLKQMGPEMIKLGQDVGIIASAMVEAFKEGSLAQLIALAVAAGFQAGFAVIPSLVEGLGGLLLSAFSTPLNYVQATLTWMELKMIEIIASIESHLPKAVQKALDFNDSYKGFKAPAFADVYKDQKESGPVFGGLDKASQYNPGDIMTDAARRFKKYVAGLPDTLKPLKDMIAQFLANVKPLAGEKKHHQGEMLPVTQYTYKPEFNAFEKMGFVMNGGSSNPATEYSRRTAAGVEKMTGLLETTVQLLSGGSGDYITDHAP